jgi:hypothetical protein
LDVHSRIKNTDSTGVGLSKVIKSAIRSSTLSRVSREKKGSGARNQLHCRDRLAVAAPGYAVPLPKNPFSDENVTRNAPSHASGFDNAEMDQNGSRVPPISDTLKMT